MKDIYYLYFIETTFIFLFGVLLFVSGSGLINQTYDGLFCKDHNFSYVGGGVEPGYVQCCKIVYDQDHLRQ